MDIKQLLQDMTTAVDAVSTPAVQIWLNWMMLIFLCSVFFVFKRKAARYALLALVLSAFLGVFIFYLTRNAMLLGITHIIFWLPLLIYLIKSHCRNPDYKPKSIYGIWVILLSLTILVSLVFDFRDLILVALGHK